MSAIDVRRIPRRRPGRALPEPPGERPDGDGPLPIARPATAVEDHRSQATIARRAADAEWDAAIAEALNELATSTQEAT